LLLSAVFRKFFTHVTYKNFSKFGGTPQPKTEIITGHSVAK